MPAIAAELGRTKMYELVINRRVAAEFGVKVPESIRVRVDRIIDH